MSQLGAIGEDEDEGEGRDDGVGPIGAADVPQCFSHFTYEVTDRERLVCDLQARIQFVKDS